MATGSELHLAVQARTALQAEGVPAAVVSMPCARIFDEQELAYQRAVLGETLAPVAI
jgi:transketolase